MIAIRKKAEIMLLKRNSATTIQIQHTQNAVSFPVVELAYVAVCMYICMHVCIHMYFKCHTMGCGI